MIVKGHITVIARDSRNTLHLHFRRFLTTYTLWATDALADEIEQFYEEYGSQRSVILNFDEVTDEVEELIMVYNIL